MFSSAERECFVMDGKADDETVIFKDAFHPTSLLDNLNKLFDDKSLFDVILQVGDRELSAHRIILAANSAYFARMFCGSLAESKQERIIMRDLDADVMESIVKFCYTSTISISTKNIFELLAASEMFQFSAIKASCCSFLLAHIQVSNCVGIYAYAGLFNDEGLRTTAINFIRNNFRKTAKEKELMKLDFINLKDILCCEKLDIITEKDIFDFVIVWTEFDLENRREHLPELLRLIQLEALPPKVLVDCIETVPLVKENTSCVKIINDAKMFHLIPDRRWEKAVKRSIASRSLFKDREVYAIGGVKRRVIYDTVDKYSFKTNSWLPCVSMAATRDSGASAVYGNKIYVAGGWDGTRTLDSMEVFSPATETWQHSSSMITCRYGFGMCECDGWLYAVGGNDDSENFLRAVERYDPVRDNWANLPPLNTARDGASVASLGGVVYCMGGDNGVAIVNTVERFDPRIGQWCYCTSMGCRRMNFGAEEIDGKIYAIGGDVAYHRLTNAMECYDIRANRWLDLPPMKCPRDSFATVNLTGRLLVIGGMSTLLELDEVEMYDPALNKWDVFASLPQERQGITAVML